MLSQQYVADKLWADPWQWHLKPAGCGAAHRRRQTLQVPAAASAFQTDGF